MQRPVKGQLVRRAAINRHPFAFQIGEGFNPGSFGHREVRFRTPAAQQQARRQPVGPTDNRRQIAEVDKIQLAVG